MSYSLLKTGFTRPSRRLHWWAVPLIGLLVGCVPVSTTDSPEATSQTPAEQVSAASQSFGMLLDASVETALGQATVGGSTQIAAPERPPNLQLLPTTTTVNLATLTIGNRLVFPAGTASGTITLTLDGAAAVSWPLGNVTLYDGSVSVALANIILSNANGDRLRIPSGTFTYNLTATSTVTDAHNWQLTANASASINPAFAAYLDHQEHSWSLALSGTRNVQQVITRQKVVAGDGSVNSDTRQVQRTISGTTPGGALTGDGTLSTYNYSRWAVTLGNVPVVWNRHAQVTTLTNLLTGTTTTSLAHDATFVSTTISGRTATIGPFTARQLSGLLGATLDPAWL
jgi:hypothetical protein